MTDPCSKEVPVIEVDMSIDGTRVCRILDRLFLTLPLPETLILGNGPEHGAGCMGGSVWRTAALHPARDARAERRYRELQRQVS
jgi:hypothetical protein